MSSKNTISESARDELITRLIEAVYANSTAAVFFHTAVAEQVGLGATEEKTMLILSGTGALTAGEIARATGLTTASVTSLIDRLESKGFVQRVRDSKDRRRVIVEPNQTRLTELIQAFGVMGEIFVGLFDGYTGEQLATILDFVTRATERSNSAIQKLNSKIENTESS